MKSPECLRQVHDICPWDKCTCRCHDGGAHDRARVTPPDKPLVGTVAK